MAATSATTAGLEVAVATSIHDVPAGEWNALAGPDDFYQSHEWLATIERDNTAEPHYLLVRRAGRLVGALPVYRVEYEGTSWYQAERFNSLLHVDGGWLTAGARRCYRSEIMVADLPAGVQDQITAELVRAGLRLAADSGLSGLGFFYLPEATVARLGRVAEVTASFDAGEAVIEGVGAGIEAYLGRSSSKLRAKIRREMRMFAATGWRTEVIPLADCLAEVALLVSKVEERHGHTTPDFLLRRLLRRQVQDVGHREVVLACRDEQGALVACTVNYAWRDTLYSRAAGLDYGRLDGSFAYFNLLVYQAIEYASGHGLNRLQLGLASTAKVERGAVVRPLWTVAVKSGEPWVRIVNPDAFTLWSEPYRRYLHAFAEEEE